MMALLMAMKMVKAKVKKKDQWKDLNSDDGLDPPKGEQLDNTMG